MSAESSREPVSDSVAEGDRLHGGYRVSGAGSVRALAWLPNAGDDGADLSAREHVDRLFPSQLGGWTIEEDPSRPGAEVLTADALSTRYFSHLADAQEEAGNVPVKHLDVDGNDFFPAVDNSVYVGVERKGATGAPFALVWNSMLVIPVVDWPMMQDALDAIVDPESLPLPAHDGEAAASVPLPVMSVDTDSDFPGPNIDWHGDWDFDHDRFIAYVETGDIAIEILPYSGAPTATEDHAVAGDSSVGDGVTAADGSSLAGGLDGPAPRRQAVGTSVVGERSTVSLLHSADAFIMVVQTGDQRTPLTSLRELTSEQFGTIYARPRR